MKNTGGEEGEVFRLCIAHVGALCRQRLHKGRRQEFEQIFWREVKAHAQPDTSGLGLNTEFVTSFGGKSGWHTR